MDIFPVTPQEKRIRDKYRNPFPTADVVIYHPNYGVVLIERGHEPLGLALPGGFIEVGETAEQAAIREMQEETGLEVELLGILAVYSHPKRDPRFHTLTISYVGRPLNPEALKAGDDAAKARYYALEELPGLQLCFDHNRAIGHFLEYLDGSRPLLPLVE